MRLSINNKWHVGISALTLLISLVGCEWTQTKRWVISTDSKDRPVTGCLSMSADGYFAAAIAMNCQKSVIQNILLCSQKRTLQYFESEPECNKVETAFKDRNGSYSLSTDNYENVPW